MKEEEGKYTITPNLELGCAIHLKNLPRMG